MPGSIISALLRRDRTNILPYSSSMTSDVLSETSIKSKYHKAFAVIAGQVLKRGHSILPQSISFQCEAGIMMSLVENLVSCLTCPHSRMYGVGWGCLAKALSGKGASGSGGYLKNTSLAFSTNSIIAIIRGSPFLH